MSNLPPDGATGPSFPKPPIPIKAPWLVYSLLKGRPVSVGQSEKMGCSFSLDFRLSSGLVCCRQTDMLATICHRIDENTVSFGDAPVCGSVVYDLRLGHCVGWCKLIVGLRIWVDAFLLFCYRLLFCYTFFLLYCVFLNEWR